MRIASARSDSEYNTLKIVARFTAFSHYFTNFQILHFSYRISTPVISTRPFLFQPLLLRDRKHIKGLLFMVFRFPGTGDLYEYERREHDKAREAFVFFR